MAKINFCTRKKFKSTKNAIFGLKKPGFLVVFTKSIFGKCSKSARFDDNNDIQEDLKIFKSDTFEKNTRLKSLSVKDDHEARL